MIGELPFYGFFSDLRRQTGLSLTPAHLADLQRLLLEKHPREPEEALALCRILWLQKAEASDTFDRLFWAHWEQLSTAFEGVMNRVEDSEDTDSSKTETKPKQPITRKNEDNRLTDEKDQIEENEPSTVSSDQETDIASTRKQSIWLQFDEGQEGGDSSRSASSEMTSDFLDHSFVFTPKYWPLSNRQLQQKWRYLRSEREKIVGDKIDIKATIEKIARERNIDQPVYELEYSTKSQDVHLLIDHGGSMTPYADLSNYLQETIVDALKPRQQQFYYFKNQPDRKLFRDPGLLEGYPISTWLRSLHKYSLVVIISDAGASRGETVPDRVNRTRTFLDNLQLRTTRILWINPLPRKRWTGNSALYISLFVTMIGAEHSDLFVLPEILKKW